MLAYNNKKAFLEVAKNEILFDNIAQMRYYHIVVILSYLKILLQIDRLAY